MSTVKTNAILDASGGNTATINSMTPTADSLQGFRNRIINGDMGIDQRNAGASVTPTVDQTYTLDRWRADLAVSSKYSVQRSSVAPAGFVNSLLVTSLSAYSIGAGQYFGINQLIEGNNVADLNWGSANAKTVTLSFWIRSSLTGTFGGAIRTGDSANLSYPFAYSISAANTWEQKSITIVGPTTGTWQTGTAAGMDVWFSLATGSNFSGTAGAWVASNLVSSTGATSVVGTNGATWYVTGVQFEVGSVATPFERIDYGRELMLCQRYYYLLASGGLKTIGLAGYYSSSVLTATTVFPVAMRTAPSLVQTTGTDYYGVYANSALDTFNSFNDGIQGATPQTAGFDASSGISGTSGSVGRVVANNASASIAFSAEL